MTAVTVRWGPVALTLRADDPHVVRWFRHFLSVEPPPVPLPRAARPVTVTALVDAGTTDGYLRAVSAGPTRCVEGYAGEYWTVGSVAGRKAWCLGDPPLTSAGRHVVIGGVGGVGGAGEGGDWLVVGPSPERVATATVRHAREVIRTGLATAGAHTLHAAFAHHPRLGGVLFAGPSGAGKTTLALALAATGGHLVSGDQTEVLLDRPGGPLGVGFPWVLRLGLGTIAGMGRYAAVEAAPLVRYQPAMAGGRFAAEARSYRSLAKAELSFVEARELLGVRCADAAPVRGLVVVREAGPDEDAELVPGTVDEIAGVLRPEYREPDPAFASFYLAAPDAQPPGQRFADLCRGLRYLPVFRLRWRADRDAPAGVLSALAAALA
jgi:hypothetical protein